MVLMLPGLVIKFQQVTSGNKILATRQQKYHFYQILYDSAIVLPRPSLFLHVQFCDMGSYFTDPNRVFNSMVLKQRIYGTVNAHLRCEIHVHIIRLTIMVI